MTKINYKRVTLFWIIIIMLIGLLFRLIFINHPLQSDDTIYMVNANTYSSTTIGNAGHHVYRVGIIWPLVILQKLFGYSIFTYYAYSLTSSMLLILAVFLLTKRLFGLKIGIVTGLIFTSSFFGLLSATHILPDVPAMLFNFLSLYLFTYVMSSKNKRKKLLFLILAAVSGFIGYLTKATLVVFLIVIPAYEFIKYRSIKNTIFYGLICFGLWIFEGFFYLIASDNFFLRIKKMLFIEDAWKGFQEDDYSGLSLFKFLFRYPMAMSRYFSYNFIMVGGLVGIILAIIKKKKEILILGLGGFLVFAFYSYKLLSINPLVPSLPTNLRYINGASHVLLIITAFAIVNLYKFTLKFLKRKSFKRIRLLSYFFYVILIFFIGMNIMELPQKLPHTLFFKNDSFFVADRMVKDAIKSNKIKANETVYTYRHNRDFPMYPNFKSLNMVPFDIKDPSKFFAYFLYSKSRMKKDLAYVLPEQLEKRSKIVENFINPPPHWEKIIEYKDIVLVHIDKYWLEYDEGSFFKLTDIKNNLGFWGIGNKKEVYLSNLKDNSIKINFINGTGKPFYVYTFQGGFDSVPDYKMDIDNIDENKYYKLKINYTIEEDLDSLNVFWSEYDEKKKIFTNNNNSDITKGNHSYVYEFKPHSGAKKFRIFFRITNNEKKNSMIINEITISETAE